MSLQSAPHFESSPYLFTARELARLAVYRAAVVARLYTDQLDEPVTAAQVTRLFEAAAKRRRESRTAA